jgi:hypothetical protein
MSLRRLRTHRACGCLRQTNKKERGVAFHGTLFQLIHGAWGSIGSGGVFAEGTAHTVAKREMQCAGPDTQGVAGDSGGPLNDKKFSKTQEPHRASKVALGNETILLQRVDLTLAFAFKPSNQRGASWTIPRHQFGSAPTASQSTR